MDERHGHRAHHRIGGLMLIEVTGARRRRRGAAFADASILVFNATLPFPAGSVFARTGDATFTALIPDTMFAFKAGDSLTGATFARTGDATFTAQIPDAVFTYAAGDSLAGATFARTGDATFTGDI